MDKKKHKHARHIPSSCTPQHAASPTTQNPSEKNRVGVLPPDWPTAPTRLLTVESVCLCRQSSEDRRECERRMEEERRERELTR